MLVPHVPDDRPELHALLTAYVRSADEAAEAAAGLPEEERPANTRWVPRVVRVGGVEPEDLSALQGEAIAEGWLEVDVAGAELRYHVPSRVADRLAA